MRLRSFIEPHNTKAARRAAERIKQAAMLLQEHAKIGLITDDLPEYRDLAIPLGASAYVLRYRIQDDPVPVVRVWHAKEQRLPTNPNHC